VIDRALDQLADVPDEAAMAAVAAAAPEADVPRLARLTRILADSGERLGPPSRNVVDIASSGGPGSLSTLLTPLYVRALGVRVAKIAVPGRPAGGLDALASLPGYDPELDATAARRVLDGCGYVHVAAGRAFCPLDAQFFAWRQANGAQAIPNLTITSLLAKKLAAGVGRVVLDIRVGAHGNFGATTAEARPNARRLVAVGAELGIRAICVLTVSSGAAQPWIGRGEALVALANVLTGTADGALSVHARDCAQMARLAAGTTDTANDPGALAAAASDAHEAMLAAHGADPRSFWSRQRMIATAMRVPVTADRTGSVQIDLGELRRVLVVRQQAAEPLSGARFPDPAGIKLEFGDGAAVVAGTPLAQVRDDDDPVQLVEQIAPHLRIVDAPVSDAVRSGMEIVGG
jgi:pyrimidine-nucleoside phosphorylase